MMRLADLKKKQNDESTRHYEQVAAEAWETNKSKYPAEILEKYQMNEPISSLALVMARLASHQRLFNR